MRPIAVRALLAGLLLVAGCGGTRWSDTVAGAPTTTPPVTTATTPAPPPIAGWVLFRDPSGIAFRHPPDWTTVPGQLGPLYVYIDSGPDSGGFRRNINVLAQTVPAGFTLADYLRISRGQMTSAGGKLEHDAAATLGGLPGHEATWLVAKNGLRIRFLSVWTVRATNAFLVTYSADAANYDAPLVDVERLIASITLPPA
jgi:hypothetical protein